MSEKSYNILDEQDINRIATFLSEGDVVGMSSMTPYSETVVKIINEIRISETMDRQATDFSNKKHINIARRIKKRGMHAEIYCISGIECREAVIRIDIEHNNIRET